MAHNHTITNSITNPGDVNSGNTRMTKVLARSVARRLQAYSVPRRRIDQARMEFASGADVLMAAKNRCAQAEEVEAAHRACPDGRHPDYLRRSLHLRR